MSKKHLNIILFGLAIIFSSCYEESKGCLDIYASNYDVSADEVCDDCCTYPKLILRVIQKYDTLVLSKLDTFENNFNQQFVFHNMMFLVNGFSLEDENNQEFATEDSISISFSENGEIIKKRVLDDVKMIVPATYNYNFGKFVSPHYYNSAHLRVGLNDDYKTAIRELLPESHVLVERADTLYLSDEEGYSMARLEVQTDPTDSMSIKVFDLKGMNFPFEHTWTIDTTFVKGADAQVLMNIDYKKWLGNIDWTLSEEEILNGLKLYFKDMFVE